MKWNPIKLLFFLFLLCETTVSCHLSPKNVKLKVVTVQTQKLAGACKETFRIESEEFRLVGDAYIPQTYGGTVIIAHPQDERGREFFPSSFIFFLVNHGFRVITFDFRNYGDSTGKVDPCFLQKDLRTVLRVFHDPREGRTFLMGFSMGAGAVFTIFPLNGKEKKWVNGIFADAPWTTPFPIVSSYSPAGASVLKLLFTLTTVKTCGKGLNCLPLFGAKHCDVRTYIVKYASDTVTPPFMAEQIFEEVPSKNKKVLTLPGEHLSGLLSFSTTPSKEYVNFLKEFLLFPRDDS